MYFRYATNVYSKNYSPTTGVDFYLKRTTVAANKNCALKLWDISGKAMQGRMLDKYIFGKNHVFSTVRSSRKSNVCLSVRLNQELTDQLPMLH